jgi:hypothetical protein
VCLTRSSALQSEDRFDERWVTVFGFPPGNIAFVLRHFQTYGEVVKYESGEVPTRLL